MDILRATVKDLLVPGSTGFLVCGELVGLLLLFRGTRAARWGRRWLTALLVLYFTLSLQGSSDLLVLGLSGGYAAVRAPKDANGTQVVVVLSNGATQIDLQDRRLGVLNVQSAYNVLEGARMYRLLGNPLMLVSGGPPVPEGASESLALAAALEELGVPADRITLEDRSSTTYWQGVNVSEWLKARRQTTFVLVTTPEHMRRAVGVFTARGLRPIPSMSAIQYGGPPFWRPTGYALQGSKNAIYEYLALAFYWCRGWI